MATSEDWLAALETYHVPVERLLRSVLERLAGDEELRRDFDLSGFQPYPSPSDEIDCQNPWFFVVAMNGAGSAYGLYVHPEVIRDGVAPWVFWEHEDDGIFFLADDSAAFFGGFVASVADWCRDRAQLERMRAALARLGVTTDVPPLDLAPADTGPNRPWLPPREADLLTTGEYLALRSTDPGSAERGLLGRWHYLRDPEAGRALDDLYRAKNWAPPRAYPRGA